MQSQTDKPTPEEDAVLAEILAQKFALRLVGEHLRPHLEELVEVHKLHPVATLAGLTGFILDYANHTHQREGFANMMQGIIDQILKTDANKPRARSHAVMLDPDTPKDGDSVVREVTERVAREQGIDPERIRHVQRVPIAMIPYVKDPERGDEDGFRRLEPDEAVASFGGTFPETMSMVLDAVIAKGYLPHTFVRSYILLDGVGPGQHVFVFTDDKRPIVRVETCPVHGTHVHDIEPGAAEDPMSYMAAPSQTRH